MALIWADGLTDGKALAPLWSVLAVATARSADDRLSVPERVAAFQAKIETEPKYAQLVQEAMVGLRDLAKQGHARTHVLIVGVSAYDSPRFEPVDTAVHGARAFAEWVLTGFINPDRPLGSIEFLNSPLPAQGDWRPGDACAARLGLGIGMTLPTESANFANIQAAYDAWMARAGTLDDNAALLYFSSHGITKSEPMLCPQDTWLPTASLGAKNLIRPVQTLFRTKDRAPSTQCFFIDACSEPTISTTQNIEELPAEVLSRAANVVVDAEREIDASIFFGSGAGGKAYGPDNDAPFFTQELIRSLQKRGGDPVTGSRKVTTNWLRITLEAAGRHLREVEHPDIRFTSGGGWQNTTTARLCDAGPAEEAFVTVECRPTAAMQGTLYVRNGGQRVNRPTPRTEQWYALVPHGHGVAGVDFQGGPFTDTVKDFATVPPICPVLLEPVPKPI